MTLNGIIYKILNPIFEDHLQLNDFGFGDLVDHATTKTVKYPLMWVVLNDVSYKNKAFNYSLSLVFADILREDKSNAVEIQSDMIQIAADVATKIRYIENNDIEIESEFLLKPFTERFTDFTAGVVCDLVIKSYQILSDCDVPSYQAVNGHRLITQASEPLTTQEGENLEYQ